MNTRPFDWMKLMVVCIVLAALTACFGGGSNGVEPDPDPDPEQPKMQIEPAPVPFGGPQPSTRPVKAGEADITSFVFGCEMPDGRRLKPQFGDVHGVFYTDIATQREQCLEEVMSKIAHCRDNTLFVSNNAECLPIFREQSTECVAHYEREQSKCEPAPTTPGPVAPVPFGGPQPSTTPVKAGEADITGFVFGCEMPDGRRLKPKFDDHPGVFYNDLPAQREQCLEAIMYNIAGCRLNTHFESNTKDREFAECLPIFREQSTECVAHYEREQSKCGPAPTTSGPVTPQLPQLPLAQSCVRTSDLEVMTDDDCRTRASAAGRGTLIPRIPGEKRRWVFRNNCDERFNIFYRWEKHPEQKISIDPKGNAKTKWTVDCYSLLSAGTIESCVWRPDSSIDSLDSCEDATEDALNLLDPF